LTSTIWRCSARWPEVNRREQHDAGVVDQDVGAAELVFDALGGGDHRDAVGDVGRDGDRAVAEVMGQRLDAVGAAGQQRDAVAVVHQRAVDHNRRASGRLRQRRPGSARPSAAAAG
jgi:hypothetical protein